jgi:hypothetical protein
MREGSVDGEGQREEKAMGGGEHEVGEDEEVGGEWAAHQTAKEGAIIFAERLMRRRLDSAGDDDADPGDDDVSVKRRQESREARQQCAERIPTVAPTFAPTSSPSTPPLGSCRGCVHGSGPCAKRTSPNGHVVECVEKHWEAGQRRCPVEYHECTNAQLVTVEPSPKVHGHTSREPATVPADGGVAVETRKNPLLLQSTTLPTSNPPPWVGH